MQIQAYNRTQNRLRQTSTARRNTTSFSDLLAGTRQKESGTQTARLSPAALAAVDYLEWEKTREPVVLPGSKGWTEENIQYLKDRYPGQLSLYERREALFTMCRMECITPEEYQKAIGTDKSIIVEDAGTATCISGPLEEGFLYPPNFADSWVDSFLTAPVSKADTLEALFDLLGHINDD